MLRTTLAGLTITSFKQIDESYCDDVQTLSDDLVKFGEVIQKIESTSGFRTYLQQKSKVMSEGQWKGKQDCPEQVKWIKVVTEMEIYGFTIWSTY